MSEATLTQDSATIKSDAPKAVLHTGGRASFMSNVMTIAQREFGSFLNSPAAYILVSVSLIMLGVYFFLYKGGIWQVDQASMSRLLSVMPYALCIAIPLYTMRSLAEEKRMGTLEMLITLPVKDSEVILGKYLAALGMVCLQLALLVVYPLVMFGVFKLGMFDWGSFWAGMFGLLLLSAAGVAIGLLASSATDSQMLAFFITGGALGFLHLIGGTVEMWRNNKLAWVGNAISYLSFETQFEPFARGVIDSRGVVYFLSIAVICVFVAFRNLESRKWS